MHNMNAWIYIIFCKIGKVQIIATKNFAKTRFVLQEKKEAKDVKFRQ